MDFKRKATFETTIEIGNKQQKQHLHLSQIKINKKIRNGNGDCVLKLSR